LPDEWVIDASSSDPDLRYNFTGDPPSVHRVAAHATAQ
jgi:hypothetical protein